MSSAAKSVGERLLSTGTSEAPFFLDWLVFDDARGAADTFFDTIVAILTAILVPRIVRMLMEDDDGDADLGLLNIGIFLFACAAVVYGEYYLTTTHLL
jgi:hypothetical protein